jgi:hypothetical protein
MQLNVLGIHSVCVNQLTAAPVINL